jgi:hypothetical protein
VISGRRTVLPWLLLLLLAVFPSSAHVAAPFQLRILSASLLVAGIALALARLGADRASSFAIELARVWLAMLLTLLGSVRLTPWTGPLADSWLSWPDGGAGVVAAAEWLQQHGLWSVASTVYNSGPVVLVLSLAWLAWMRDPKLHRIADAFAACGVVGLLVYVVAPASGPRLDDEWLGCSAGAQPGWAAIRSGAVMTLEAPIGAIACPSFHAISATILLLAVRSRLALLWWAAFVISAGPVGGHYLIDLVAGVGLAVGAWWVVARIPGLAEAAPDNVRAMRR